MLSRWMLALECLLCLGLASRAADPIWAARLPETETHPCLLFGPGDLPALRARLEQLPYRGWWEGVRQAGDPVSLAFTWQITGDDTKAERVLGWRPSVSLPDGIAFMAAWASTSG